MMIRLVLDCTFALLALINPMSKIFVLSTLLKDSNDSEIRQLAIRASIIAMGILVVFALVGNILYFRGHKTAPFRARMELGRLVLTMTDPSF